MKYIVALLLLLSVKYTIGQTTSENIVIITLDGLRWQEVFEGADSILSFDTAASYNTRYIKKRFWDTDANSRRKKLMPFLWSVVANNGLILGNRNYGNYFNNANPYWFSYPGYNEIFTGYPDTLVNSNDKIPNKNETVLEHLNKKPAYTNKTAVFASWDVFASIFNEQRSGLLINDGFRNLQGKLTAQQEFHNHMQHQMPDLFHGAERLDIATFNIAYEYLKVNQPKIFYIGFGDTDEFAHAGLYDLYLDAAQKTDKWIEDIWTYLQSTPKYKNKTTMIITTDHGRGLAANGNWRHHGSQIPHASEMWLAAIGPSIKPLGESKTKAQAYQGQIAGAIAAILGQSYKPATHQPLSLLPIIK